MRTFDPEVFNVQWSAVRLGVDYGPGNLAADLAADVLRGMYRDLMHRSVLDRVLATTDLEGNPFVHVWLSPAGAWEVAALAGDGGRLRGEADAGASGGRGARVRLDVGSGRGDGGGEGDVPRGVEP